MNDFDVFWQVYPKKKSKGQARKTWDKLKKAKCLPEWDILQTAITIAKASRDWEKDGGQFIPYPSTWLNAEGWEDDYEVEISETNEQRTIQPNKLRLFPIMGKNCNVKGCNIPAVYKDSSGSYDNYKCADHMPQRVKELYA